MPKERRLPGSKSVALWDSSGRVKFTPEELEQFFQEAQALLQGWKYQMIQLSTAQTEKLQQTAADLSHYTYSTGWGDADYKVVLKTLINEVKAGGHEPHDSLESLLAEKAGRDDIDERIAFGFIRKYIKDYKNGEEIEKDAPQSYQPTTMELPSDYKPARKVDRLISKRLRHHRDLKKMSRSMVAAKSRMTTTLIRYIDYGDEIEIQPEWLEAYAAAVGTSGYAVMQECGLL